MVVPISSRFIQLSEADFFLFCQELRDFRIERSADGTITIMDPTGSETSGLNVEVSTEVVNWNRKERPGRVFDSCRGFTLPNDAVRSPDTAWIALERWLALPEADRTKFAHISPDFVIEIRSDHDNLTDLQSKMEEYRANGVRLGWLIDPKAEEVWVYRIDGTTDHITSFEIPLSGENVLIGFELKLSDCWPEAA